MNFLTARKNMVEGQLRPNRIRNQRVLEVFSKVPRERFLPQDVQEVAYSDTLLKLECGRVVLPPLVQARMLQALDVQPTEKVLVVGGLEGYFPALLHELGADVTVLEPHKKYATNGQNNLQDMNYSGSQWVVKDGASGYAVHAPYQAIVVNFSFSEIPTALLEQLQNGGCLMAVVPLDGVAVLVKYTRQGKNFSHEIIGETQVLPLLEREQKAAQFVF